MAAESLEKLQGALRCSLCHGPFRKPHTFPACGHTFCYECVIPTLEGPGISKSECPDCGIPGWKNDLVQNRTLDNAVDLTAALAQRVNPGLRRKKSRLGLLRQQPRHRLAMVAAAASPAPSSDARGTSSKRRRRGRSVPEQAAAEDTLDGAAQLDEAGLSASARVQPAAADSSPAGAVMQTRRPSAAAAAAEEHPPAAAAAPEPAACSGESASRPRSPRCNPTTPPAVVYDSDWERRMLAMSPPGPEELPGLEEEIEQLRRALALCDILPCRSDAAQPAGERRVQADAEQDEHAARKPPAADAPGFAAAGHAQQAPSGAGKAGVQAKEQLLPSRGRDGQALDAVVVPDSEDEDFKQAPQPRRRPQQQPAQHRRQRAPRGRPSGKAALHVGDAVEVAWEMGGRLEPFVGHVLAVKQGRHTIEYLDGEVAEHELDEEQWRPLPQPEYQQALQRHQQRGGSHPPGGDGSCDGAPPQEGAVDVETAIAAVAQPAGESAGGAGAGAGSSLPRSLVDAQPPGSAAFRTQREEPRVLQKATRTPLPAQRPAAPPPTLGKQPRHARHDGQHEGLRGGSTLKENVEGLEADDPAWLRPAALHGGTQAGPAQAQQLFSRKRKFHGGGGGQPPTLPEPPVLRQQRQAAAGQACAAQPVPSTQDAAGVLFGMLAGPAAAPHPAAGPAGAAGPWPTTDHPTPHRSQAAEALDPCAEPGSRLDGCAAVGGASPELGVEPRRQHEEGSEPTLGDAADLFKGLSEVEVVSLLSPDGPAAAAADAEDELPGVSEPGERQGRCLVLGSKSGDLQRRVLRLQAALGGAAVEEAVTERTTHIVVQTDEKLCVQARSISYLLALARGCWVVSHTYLTACMEAGCWLPERDYEAQGTEDGPDAPRRARERHASGGPGLFAGHRVILTGKNRSQIAARVHHAAQQVVEAEGGLVMQGKGAGAVHGEGGTRRSPSPQCPPLLVYVAPRSEDAVAALKHAARRYPGTPALHHNWVLDSVARGVLLDREGYRITSQCPMPGGGKSGCCTQGA